MTWTLLLLLGGGYSTVIPGFASKDACETAARQIRLTLSRPQPEHGPKPYENFVRANQIWHVCVASGP